MPPALPVHFPMLARLVSLRIRNLALVEDLTWELAPGFTAVTGETGSGKSIIVGALKLILGERADKSLLRTGAESCTVEAVFEVFGAARLNPLLEELGVEQCEEDQLLIKRVVSSGGGNRQFINGSPATLAALSRVGDLLVDLHGPHDHQSLLSSEKQLELLDSFAAAEEARARYEATYRECQRLRGEHRSLAEGEAALERELDLLRHQVSEIENAQLQPGEEEECVGRYTAASHSRRLVDLVGGVLAGLSEGEDPVLERVRELSRSVREIERVDARGKEFVEALGRAVTELEELANSLQHYAGDLELDPAQLAELEQRVTLFETLKRKYGGSIEAVIEFGAAAAERLRKIESRGDELVRLEKEIKALEERLAREGAQLSKARAKGAPDLASGVARHLRDLGFKKAGFQVELHPLPQPALHGLEAVEFAFAPNPGEPSKPLKAIASSGEISRVMLAVKSSLAAQDQVALLVFDEIDANVGGEVAHAVGAKMAELGKARQVICISHLPPVAARAGTQFAVTKEFANGRTISQLTHLEGEARIDELARMLGGRTDSALAHARALLEQREG